MSTLAAPAVPLRHDAPTIGLVSVAHGLSHFCQLIVPPLFPWIAPAFGLSYTELGLLMTVFFVVSCIGQALAGFVVDHYGARRVLYAGMACLALAALGLAASPNYATMMAFMALAGIGNCVFHPVDFSILNGRVSQPRLGHAYAAHGISGNLGWALAPVFVVGVAQISSWRIALAAVAGVVALALIALVWWRDAIDPTPRAAGAAPDGSKAVAAAVDDSTFGFLRLPAVWFCFLFFLTFAVALSGVQTFGPAAAGQLHGVSAADIALCLSAYMFAAAAAMVLGGHLVREPQRSVRIVALGFGLAALFALAIGFGDWPGWMVPVLFALMGLGAGVAGPSRDLLVKQATPAGATGRVYGVVYSGLDVGQAIAPALLGVLMDGGQYGAVWFVIAAAQALLIVNGFNLRRRRQPALAAAPT
jgi:FSR family fosmidomycin resistance protein-like MFS transporter